MKWVLLLMMLLIPVGVVYGATITPQIEKLPQEVLDYFHDTPGKLANNSQFDAILQEKWDQMAYIISKSTFGLDLP
jgi:predicted PurR-regulated permease PerM